MKKIQTSKNIANQQVVGVRHLIDPESGEQFDTIQTISSEKDINFHKVWITHLIQALNVVENKK